MEALAGVPTPGSLALRRREPGRPRREPDHLEHPALDDGARPGADVQLGPAPAAAELDDLLHPVARLGRVGPGRLLGEPHDDQPRERGGQLRAGDRP